MRAQLVLLALGICCFLGPACRHLEANDDIVAECGSYREVYRRCL